MKKGIQILMSILLVVNLFPAITRIVAAEKIKLDEHSVEAKSSLNHEAKFAVDGDKTTYYQTPSTSSNEDYHRNLDIKLDAVYEIEKIIIYNNEGSYNHYQVYASKTGAEFKKIAYKENDEIANLKQGDVYEFDSSIEASQIRLLLSYNSAGMQGNVAEVELYGKKKGDIEKEVDSIQVNDFEDTTWSDEFKHFDQDKAYANEKTKQEMSAMVGRVIGEEWIDDFIFEIKNFGEHQNDMYEITNGDDGKIIIRGNNGIAMASGWNYYLRYHCNVDYNPLFVSNLKMPESLPQLKQAIVQETQYDVRYALNFCTYSYTMAFWDWDEYEAFIDWAAMSGVNLVLDIVGQEEIIRRTLLEYGYSDEEIKDYIVGPGYFAWYYMQNMTSYGGPLPNDWFEQRVELGRKMHDRMQTFGIRPALSGFSGMVPNNFKQKFNDAVIVEQGGWPYDGAFQRPDMLRVYVNEGQADYFDQMADTFYQAQKDVFGEITDFYAVDPFHEGGKTGDMDLTKVYATVQNKMLEHDPNGIWIIKQWSGALNDAKLKGLEEKEHTLVLDLSSEYNSYANVMERNQIPWVWNMIHAFGGKLGMEANVGVVSQDIPAAYDQYDYMKGIGITPESLERSPMIYELLWDMAWTKDPIDPMMWGSKYMERRYGGVNDDLMEAWSILLRTVYDSRGNDIAESLTNARPTENFNSTSSWGRGTIPYDREELEKAFKIYIDNYDEFKDSECYIYDLVDLTRQVLSNASIDYHKRMMDAYRSKDTLLFDTYSQHFLDLIQIQNDVLNTSDHFQTGTWLQEARTMMDESDDWTKDLFEFNARSLITTWGGDRASNYGGLRDYSYRQWAGITEDYYLARWTKWVNNYRTALTAGTTPKSENWFLFEWEWANRKSDEGYDYPTESQTSDDLGALARTVYDEFTITNIDRFGGEDDASDFGNIAYKKPVTSSSKTNTDQLKQLTDGDDAVGWIGGANEWPVSFTIDLQGMANITNLEMNIANQALGLPYTYEIEILQDGQWKKIAQDDNGSIGGIVKIDYTGKGEEIRYTFHSLDASKTPEFIEFKVFGTMVESAYQNIAKGARAVTDKNGEQPNITDDSLDTRWAQTTNTFPANVEITLPNLAYVDDVEVYFEKAGLRFKYQVSIEDSNGERSVILDKSQSFEDMQDMYKIPVNRKISKIFINFLERDTNGPFYLASPCLREVKALVETNGEDQMDYENTALYRTGEIWNKNTDEITTTTLMSDGDVNTSAFVTAPGYAFVPSEFAIDLGEETYINTTNIYFEKAGLRFQFEVLGEDAQGNRTQLLDMTKNTNDIKKVYNIDVQGTYKKIIVNEIGRAQGGSFYLASAGISEIEVFTAPENISSFASIQNSDGMDLQTLFDNDDTTFVTLTEHDKKEIIFTYDEAQDIAAIEMLKASEGALQYIISYRGDSTSQWRTLTDKSKNMQEKDKTIYQPRTSFLAKEVKIELLNKDIDMCEIRIYRENFTKELIRYLGQLEKEVSQYHPGSYAGDYDADVYAAFMAKIDEIRHMDISKYNSSQVAELREQLNKAYMTLRLGYVSVDRSQLLSTINEAYVYRGMEEFMNASFLLDAYQSAYIVYSTYKVSQSELNAAVDDLMVINEKASSLLRLIEIYHVYDNVKEDGYQTDTWLRFIAAKTETLSFIETMDADQQQIEQAITELQDAYQALVRDENELLSRTILKAVIDKADAAILNTNMDMLSTAVKDSILNRLNEAKAIYADKNAGNDAYISAWLKLAESLHYLDFKADKSLLSKLIADCELIKIDDYDFGVEIFMRALADAKVVMNDMNALQNRIDLTYTNLYQAMNALLASGESDKALLESTITTLKELVKDGSQYRHNQSWQMFEDALAHAEAMYHDENASPVMIRNAILMLTSAFEDLRLLPDEQLLADLHSYIAMVKNVNFRNYREGDVSFVQNVYDEVQLLLSHIAEISNETLMNAHMKIVEAKRILEDEMILEQEIDLNEEVIISQVFPSKDQLQSNAISNRAVHGSARTGDMQNIAYQIGLLMSSGAMLCIVKIKRNRKKK